jgi:hypothetical protein
MGLWKRAIEAVGKVCQPHMECLQTMTGIFSGISSKRLDENQGLREKKKALLRTLMVRLLCGLENGYGIC